MAKRSPMNSIYAWRLLGDYLCSNVPPKLRICNPCFSPVSLHVSSTLLAGGDALSSGDGELRSRLLHFLRLNGLGQHAGGRRSRRRRTQRDAFAAATARSDGNGPGAYFFNAVWVKSSLFDGFEKLTRDTGTTLYPADFQNHVKFLNFFPIIILLDQSLVFFTVFLMLILKRILLVLVPLNFHILKLVLQNFEVF